jgi:hypothetical protein
MVRLSYAWRGVNAPTFPLNLADDPHRWTLGFGVGGLLYVYAVAVLWYRVGRFIDGARGNKSFTEDPARAPSLGVAIFAAAWAISLLGFSVFGIYSRFFQNGFPARQNLVFFLNDPEFLVSDVLFLLWSVILTLVFGRKLVRAIVHGHQDSISV